MSINFILIVFEGGGAISLMWKIDCFKSINRTLCPIKNLSKSTAEEREKHTFTTIINHTIVLNVFYFYMSILPIPIRWLFTLCAYSQCETCSKEIIVCIE